MRQNEYHSIEIPFVELAFPRQDRQLFGKGYFYLEKDMDKYCRSCKNMKQIDDFYEKNSRCKKCVCEYAKQQRKLYKQKRSCPDCGKGILPTSKQCKSCSINSKRRKQRYCPDCGIVVSKQATRCKLCQNRKHSRDLGYPIGRKMVNHQGYVLVKVDSQSKHNYQPEHRLVMEEAIGRKLSQDEHVHHIDANKQNNAIDNLALLTAEQHGIFNRIMKVCKTTNSNNFAEVVVKSIVARFPELLINLQVLYLDSQRKFPPFDSKNNK